MVLGLRGTIDCIYATGASPTSSTSSQGAEAEVVRHEHAGTGYDPFAKSGYKRAKRCCKGNAQSWVLEEPAVHCISGSGHQAR